MVEFIQSEDIAGLIEDNSVVGLTGFGGMGQAEEVLKEIKKSFLNRNSPKNLTIFHPAGQSDGRIGIEHLAIEGLIKRVIGAHWGMAPKMRKLIEDNKIEAYCLPQGQLTHLLRTMANALPGHISQIGLETFVDPRLEGGKINNLSQEKEDFIDLIKIEGKDYLFYKSIKLDYVILKGTTIDEDGNLSTEEEPLKLEILSAAQAAKAAGGKVIVQAKYQSRKGEIHPKSITVPGFLIDYVVMVEEPEKNHRQTPDYFFNPYFNGDLTDPLAKVPVSTSEIRKFIASRAYKELSKNSIVNLGVGIPGDELGPIIDKNNRSLKTITTLESGPIGGIPQGKNQFGVSKNPSIILDQANQFDFYHGVGVDVTFMGAGEVDQFGNVNVSKFSNRIAGCGGFIDITQTAKKVVFCMTFTASDFEVNLTRKKKVKVHKNGKLKFKKNVEMITFSGDFAVKNNIKVIYVTERCVFELTKSGLQLIEIFPGINLQEDILDVMEFAPLISDEIREKISN